MKIFGFPVVVFAEGKRYSSWCPQLDVASQGKTERSALSNLKEAVGLHLECLSQSDLKELKRSSPKITTIKVPMPA